MKRIVYVICSICICVLLSGCNKDTADSITSGEVYLNIIKRSFPDSKIYSDDKDNFVVMDKDGTVKIVRVSAGLSTDVKVLKLK